MPHIVSFVFHPPTQEKNLKIVLKAKPSIHLLKEKFLLHTSGNTLGRIHLPGPSASL